ncbi:MAG: metalloregulator ArsR/SmtB family transcription factor [Acidobacteriota bacterium]
MDGLITLQTTPIYARLTDLADPLRARLLLLLEGHELTVGELCTIIQSPQSTVSRHLKTLADGGWVSARREGTSRLYSARGTELDASGRRLWSLVREQISADFDASQDQHRLQEVLAQRRTRSQEFFSTRAGAWAQLRQELFGDHFDLLAIAGLLSSDWVIGDLGAGTGQLAHHLAPFVRQVIAVDDSPAMLDAARQRLLNRNNVEMRNGRLEALPVSDGELDAAILSLVLHHLPDPSAVLAETRRALRPGGRLLVVDMTPHSREEYRSQMGHIWLGFPSQQITEWLEEASFKNSRVVSLPARADAKGPALFAASAEAA